MRGEYVHIEKRGFGLVELPPRARRIPVFSRFGIVIKGTTSACAENTSAERFEETLDRNYLRVRGEYAVNTTEAWKKWELPPRARRIRGEPVG